MIQPSTSKHEVSMSRQSTAAKRNVLAKSFSALRKSGGHGPSKTKPVHGKTRSLAAMKRGRRPIPQTLYTEDTL